MQIVPAGLKHPVRMSVTSATNLKRHIELKHPTSLGKHPQVNDDHKKSLTKGKTMSQQLWLLKVICVCGSIAARL